MEETAVLIERSQAGEKEAREVLIEDKLGLVRHIVKRFVGRGYDAEDLFQIGCIGLIKAIDKAGWIPTSPTLSTGMCRWRQRKGNPRSGAAANCSSSTEDFPKPIRERPVLQGIR